ncbi:hypothetical protein [Lichenicola sp.]|uniref:hypothetical protein n=1 Tax=Lichenicola sp. TaxID=2804529 RepID=UPI003AFFA8FF
MDMSTAETSGWRVLSEQDLDEMFTIRDALLTPAGRAAFAEMRSATACSDHSVSRGYLPTLLRFEKPVDIIPVEENQKNVRRRNAALKTDQIRPARLVDDKAC